ncbi:MAG: DUF1887 family CARF protein [Comamonadaceae bacterium]|nr:DUF1887 family CARF protein [Comamonadaceae bacterium]
MNHPSAAVHVCIATGQNAANLIPLKQLQAKHVLILETPDMKAKGSGKNLQHALPKNVQAERIDFDDSSPQSIVASAARLVEEKLDGRHTIFHITGGPKLMVLALQDQLKMVEAGTGTLQLVYADTFKQKLDWYSPDGRTSQQDMQDVLTLQDQFLLQGYRTASDTRPQTAWEQVLKRQGMTRILAQQAPCLTAGALRALTATASQASLQAQFHFPPPRALANILRKAHRQGLLHWSEHEPMQVQFTSRDDARYFAGLWLEEHAFLQLDSHFKDGQYAMGVKIERHSKGQSTPNELDGIVVHRNRTLLLECKTGKQNEADARDALYKLGQLRNEIGGAAGQALYLSIHPITPASKTRARDFRISVLDGPGITQLGDFLRAWRDGA